MKMEVLSFNFVFLKWNVSSGCHSFFPLCRSLVLQCEHLNYYTQKAGSFSSSQTIGLSISQLLTYAGVCYFFSFCWSLVDLQCCVSFRCIAKWVSYTYIYSFFFFKILIHISHYRAFSRVPCAIQKVLIATYFIVVGINWHAGDFWALMSEYSNPWSTENRMKVTFLAMQIIMAKHYSPPPLNLFSFLPKWKKIII